MIICCYLIVYRSFVIISAIVIGFSCLFIVYCSLTYRSLLIIHDIFISFIVIITFIARSPFTIVLFTLVYRSSLISFALLFFRFVYRSSLHSSLSFLCFVHRSFHSLFSLFLFSYRSSLCSSLLLLSLGVIWSIVEKED